MKFLLPTVYSVELSGTILDRPDAIADKDTRVNCVSRASVHVAQ